MTSGHHSGWDIRGPAWERRARKHWLLDTFGDGTEAPCAWCGDPVTFETMHVDRFPICGHACRVIVGDKPCMATAKDHERGALGHEFKPGSYRRTNVVVACARCNLTRCSRCRGMYEQIDLDAALDLGLVRISELETDEEGRVIVPSWLTMAERFGPPFGTEIQIPPGVYRNGDVITVTTEETIE